MFWMSLFARLHAPRRISRATLFLIALFPAIAAAQSFDPPAPHAAFVDPDNGNDIGSLGTPASPYQSLVKGTQAAWQLIQRNVKAGEETLQYFDAAVQWAVDAPGLPVTTGTAAMVVDRDDLLGSYPDALLFLRLESLGFDVTLVTDNRVPVNQFTAAMAEQFDLLVITESASSGNVQPLANVNMPVINMRGSSWGDWGMSLDPGPSQSVGSQLTIVDESSPLAANTTGTVAVYYSNWLFNHTPQSALPAGANPVATLASDANQVCLFSIEAGAALTGSQPAPGRRVGFFLFGRPRTVNSTAYVFMERDPALQPEVVFAQGHIPMDSPFRMTSELQLRAGWNSTFTQQLPTSYATILDGLNQNFMIEFSGEGSSDTRLEGFTLVNGFHDSADRGGGAIYADGGGLSRAVVSKCIFRDNFASFQGGAVFIIENDAELAMLDCIFTANDSPNGLAISTRNGPKLEIERCLFADNDNPVGGRSVIYFANGAQRSTRIVNCVFANNDIGGANSRVVELNGAETDDRRHHVYNNTFYNNRVSGEVLYDLDNAGGSQLSRLNIYNNLFVGNVCTAAQPMPIFQRFIADPGQTVTNLGNNLVFGNVNYNVSNPTGNGPFIAVGSTAIQGDPRLVDAPGGDYRIATNSAAIDAGFPESSVLVDFNGNSRPQGAGLDIGAFEFDGAQQLNSIRDWPLYF